MWFLMARTKKTVRRNSPPPSISIRAAIAAAQAMEQAAECDRERELNVTGREKKVTGRELQVTGREKKVIGKEQSSAPFVG